MKVFEVNDKRFNVSLELFFEGQYFNFNDVSFHLNKEAETLDIYVVSKWQLDNLTEQRAWEEIKRGENTYDYLVASSKEFAELVKPYKLRFSVIEDYGNGSFEVCYLSNNKLVWKQSDPQF